MPDRLLGRILLVTLAVGILYVGLAWTPSHSAVVLSWLGFASNGLVAGTAQSMRSDDFLVATPLIRAVVTNHFGPVDLISPYKETFRSFVASPIHDWSLLFRPQFWGFLVLPAASALSFYFYAFYASFVIGYTCLLRRLGAAPEVAVLVCLILLCSQLPQVWWTQRAPVYALAPWPLLAFLWRVRWFIRLPAIAYATMVWLFGELYPPTIIGIVFTWAVLVLVFTPDEVMPRHWLPRVLPGALAAAAGSVGVWTYFGNLIPLMEATAYPGHRVSGGGGIPWTMMVTHLFPYFTTLGYRPLIPAFNMCEVGVVGSHLALILLIFADHRALADWCGRHLQSLAILGGAILLMAAWVMLPIPAIYGMPLLWHLSRPGALMWALGLLWTIGLAMAFSNVPLQFTLRRLGVFALTIIAAWTVSKLLLLDPASEAAAVVHAPRDALRTDRYDLYVLVPMGVLAILRYCRADWMLPRLRTGLLLCALLPLAVTFGRFNPVQRADAIMSTATTPLLEASKALAAANPHGWAAVPGPYGLVLGAFGIPAINQVLFHPELAFFRKLYPDMQAEEFNQIFNRYANLHLTTEAKPWNSRPDVILVPIFDVGTPLPVALGHVGIDRTVPASGGVTLTVQPQGDGIHWRLVADGWAPFAGLTASQRLELFFNDGRILSARAIRVPRTDVGDHFRDRAYDTAGFQMEVMVELPAPADRVPAHSLTIVAVDGQKPPVLLSSD